METTVVYASMWGKYPSVIWCYDNNAFPKYSPIHSIYSSSFWEYTSNSSCISSYLIRCFTASSPFSSQETFIYNFIMLRKQNKHSWLFRNLQYLLTSMTITPLHTPPTFASKISIGPFIIWSFSPVPSGKIVRRLWDHSNTTSSQVRLSR